MLFSKRLPDFLRYRRQNNKKGENSARFQQLINFYNKIKIAQI